MYFKDQNTEQLLEFVRRSNTSFVDQEFPADLSSLSPKSDAVRNLPISWQRPTELSAHPSLYTILRPSAIRQGRLGNCWFVAACACLVQHESAWRKVVALPRLQTWSKYHGLFVFRFWRFGVWVTVVVDDLLPTLNGELLYCHSSDPNEYWCALLEKAYAKLLGSYEALEGGELADALIDFTGGYTECLDFGLRPLPTFKTPGPLPAYGTFDNILVPPQSLNSSFLSPWKDSILCDSAYKLLYRYHIAGSMIAAAISLLNPLNLDLQNHRYAQLLSLSHMATVPPPQQFNSALTPRTAYQMDVIASFSCLYGC
ncbi:unnamed protein product [Dicrocoelium dendriticum]|nr:unnamed protein product [Dicrocoelium dendriticum]